MKLYNNPLICNQTIKKLIWIRSILFNKMIIDHKVTISIFIIESSNNINNRNPLAKLLRHCAIVVSLLFCTSYTCIIYHHAANWVYPYPICIRHYGRIDRTGNRVSISGNIISVTERTFVAVGSCGHDAIRFYARFLALWKNSLPYHLTIEIGNV